VLFKLDIDGFEIKAIEGALLLLQNYNVENLYIEISSMWWSRGNMHTFEFGICILSKMIDLGYSIHLLSNTEELIDPPITKATFLEMVKREESVNYYFKKTH